MLLWQLDAAWRLTQLLTAGLSDDECLWLPTANAWTVRRAPDDTWRADWSEPEPDPAPLATIGWLSWHIGWWWSDVYVRATGGAPLAPGDVAWPGTAEAAERWLADCHRRWRELVSALTPAQVASVELAERCWPLRGLPFSHVVAWVNAELMKNTAEIGSLRRMYASVERAETQPPRL